MTPDEIIAVAREAGYQHLPTVRLAYSEFDLQRFAELIAAREREACAKVCEGRIGGAVQTNEWWAGFRTAMAQCASAIRARSN